MKAFWRGQPSKEEEAEYELVNGIQLPELCNPNKDSGLVSTFRKGGSFRGFPAVLEIVVIDDEGKKKHHKPQEFIVSETETGIYAMPMQNCVWKKGLWNNAEGEGIVKDVEEGVKDVVSKVDKEVQSFEPKRALGFTYKQLLVIGLIGLVTVKIFK